MSGRVYRPIPRAPMVRAAVAILLAVALVACGAATPTPTTAPTLALPTATILRFPATPATAVPTATPSAAPATRVATAPATAPLATAASASVVVTQQGIPSRSPDMTAGTPSDGWVLDRIETDTSGGQVALILRFQPLPGQASAPQAEAWFEPGDNTYIIAVHGVRGTNVLLRPGDVTPVAAAPLRGYYALRVRDDTILALAVAAARPAVSWALAADDTPGALRLTVESR